MTNTIRIKMNELTLVEFKKIASLIEKHYVADESNVQNIIHTTQYVIDRRGLFPRRVLL